MIRKLYAKLPLVPLGSTKSAQKRSVFRMLQSRSFTNTLVLHAPPEQRETMLASAEGASGKKLEHPTRVLRKSAFYTTVFGTNYTKHTVF